MTVRATLLLLLVLPRPVHAGPTLAQRLRQEVSRLEELERASGQLVALEQQLDDLRHEQRQLGYEVDEARRRIAGLERRTRQRGKQLQRRLRSLYKLSRGGMLRLVLDGARGGDLHRRLAAVRLVLHRDARELALYRQEKHDLVARQSRLRQKLQRSHDLQRQLDERQAELAQIRDSQRRTVRQLQRSRRAMGQLAGPHRRLARRIAELSYRVHTAGGFAARRGRLPRPIPGPVVGVFGKRRLEGRGGVELLRHGITIRPHVRRGRVQAVAAGTVRMAAPLSGYGAVVLLEHRGGYFTLYGYLSRVAVEAGQRLKQGETVGRAGADPITGRPATYFEIRRGERPLDPALWIRR